MIFNRYPAMPFFPRILPRLRPPAKPWHCRHRNLSHQHPQPPMGTIIGDPEDFFKYTSGRWLWDEETQLKERYRKFDIYELQKAAMEATSTGSCMSMEKMGEGSYNKSFCLTMENGTVVVARVPNPNAGPAFLTTASEVATMDFLRNTLQLPVPKVLAWNSTPGSRSRVGAEYIIMEHAPGKNLADAWTEMDTVHKARTVKDAIDVQRKLLSVRFSEYGCLYYTKDAPSGSRPAIVEGDGVSDEAKSDIANRYSIGPVVDTEFWKKERGEMDIDRGPWTSAITYIQDPAHREISWIEKHAKPRSPDDPLFESHSQNDPAEHISLLQRYIAIAPYLMPHEKDILGSFLWHTDLRTPNIFVDDNGNITSIIDWQSAKAAPLFLQGRHPRFVNYNGEVRLKLPEDFDQLDQDAQAEVKDQVAKSTLIYLYEKYTAKTNPLLDRVLRYPNGKTLAQPTHYVANTWDEEIIPFRETLIRLQRDWDSLNHDVKCPIYFSPEDIRKHREDGKDWNEMQDFWDELSGIVERDGWTSHDTYVEVKPYFDKIQDEKSSQSGREGKS
ncbi:phosphotransferase family protein [Aspergillus sclerotioniger CBS 115572]|uniref:Altered inheritance of mitochondria protein 9, mitochondrial n=1 Tax=Aspergillus sclerotioniger CBS 115572 TaxID=1450535 RepID=A0A317VW75_9EURO|nr:phosphotransferase family protein [Aspergillus sclerotioniger CBS 115572]PWY78015.1 phosphotransferase family protein [Aspergillus sclerotioniger CBS 115572]